jgi:serine/threonine-protein kinase
MSLALRIDEVCTRFEDAWAAGQRPRIEDYVQHTMEPERSVLVRELVLVDVHYRRLLGEQIQPADYQNRFPRLDLDWISRAVAAGASSRAGGISDTVRSGRNDAPDEATFNAPDLPGYEILGVLGRGGMGVVYRARHTKLDRIVALKMILAGEHAGSQELDRFQREAEAAARLQHPNMVDIYEVGDHQGRPYLALEYVDGGSLADRVAGVAQPVREAAHLVETLARAMHHAHQRGIVHRDLKPANVLLSVEGVPKISDFGLAKHLHAPASQTQTGAVLGTPSYMAPEQVAGQPGQIGPPTDIYALGAILYELVTGRPPHQGITLLDTLEHVRSQEPTPPGRLQPKVPRDLETICLKCLSKEPHKRYASAEALADDLRRFLLGEPITARPAGVWERALKWARRRPAAAALAVVSSSAGLLLVGTLATSNVLIRQEKAQADANFRLAHDAVDRYLTRISESRLLNEPGLQPLRKELLDTARDFYEKFIAERGQDPAVRTELARAYYRLADITAEIESKSKAIELYQKSLAIFQQLASDQPRSAQLQMQLGQCFNNLGQAYAETGQFAPAEEAHQRALALRRQLVSQHPEVAEYQRHLAYSHHNLGHVYQQTGRTRDAEAAYQEALAVWTRLTDRDPNYTQYQSDRSATLNDLGLLYEADSQLAQAETAHQEALGIRQDLVKHHPHIAAYQRALAASHTNLGIVYRRIGQLDRAGDVSQQAAAFYEKLVAANPQVVQFRVDLGATYGNVALILSDQGKHETALDWHRRGIGLLEGVLEQEPRHGLARQYLRNARFNRALSLSPLGQYAAAIEDCDRAIELSDEPLRRRIRFYRATVLARKGDYVSALTEAEAAAKDPIDFYSAAAVYAVSSTVASQDPYVPEADRKTLEERYAARAVELLAQAHAGAFFKNPKNLESLNEDTDFDPLRSRRDFQALLKQIDQDAKREAP